MTEVEATGGSLEEQRRIRAAKIEALRDAGVQPYPDKFERTALSSDLAAEFAALEEGGETEVTHAVAGRIMLARRMGKLVFLTLQDPGGTIQLFVSKGVVGDEAFERVSDLDLGDWVGSSGTVIRTRTGELSIKSTGVTLLAKALRPLPDKWHGLSDVDARFRQRYVDLMVNPDARRAFDIRHTTVATVRRVLVDHGFVEVETPILQTEAGGAAARPFATHHNALDQEMFLRIATELHLKRLVVGGMERVFEIGRIFRNEGIDTRHNPEFTSVEIYQALGNQDDMMALAEEIVAESAQAALGTTVVETTDGPLDLSPPWPRRKMADLILEVTGHTMDPRMPVDEARAICDELGLEYEPRWGSGRLMFEVFDERVERTLRSPTLVHEYPTEVSPLSRRNDEVPEYCDRFEIFILSRELGNAFSELNDPVLQRAAFEQEVKDAMAGDEDAHQTVDEDYIRALEFGLPPTGGMGIGIDRLVMLLAGVDSIREVVLFPTMRPEVF